MRSLQFYCVSTMPFLTLMVVGFLTHSVYWTQTIRSVLCIPAHAKPDWFCRTPHLHAHNGDEIPNANIGVITRLHWNPCRNPARGLREIKRRPSGQASCVDTRAGAGGERTSTGTLWGVGHLLQLRYWRSGCRVIYLINCAAQIDDLAWIQDVAFDMQCQYFTKIKRVPEIRGAGVCSLL